MGGGCLLCRRWLVCAATPRLKPFSISPMINRLTDLCGHSCRWSTLICAYTHTPGHTHTHAHTRTHIHTHTQTHAFSHDNDICMYSPSLYSYAYICMQITTLRL